MRSDFFNCSPPWVIIIISRHGILLNPRLTSSAVSVLLTVFVPPERELQMHSVTSGFSLGAGVPNSGAHACMASILLTEPPPCPKPYV